jgi:hypothetical protein
MTQRTMQTEPNPTVVVRAGFDVHVEGWENERILAETKSRWGLKLERRKDTVEVQIGGSGEVLVPLNSSVTVYAGKSADVQKIRGSVTVYAGWKALIREVGTLVHASAGGSLDFDCERILGDDVKFSAGLDLRCAIRLPIDARLMINDLGGYWEGVIGSGRIKLRLKAGGDVTLVTDQEILVLPPHYVLGKVERPDDSKK